MSFPRGTEMFQFPRFAFGSYGFRSQIPSSLMSRHPLSEIKIVLSNRGGHGMADRSLGGFPHSEIQGSKPVRGSPRLIAAYHVLHRLSAPRHPPDTLMTLDHSHHRCPLGAHTCASDQKDIDARHRPKGGARSTQRVDPRPLLPNMSEAGGGQASPSPSPASCAIRLTTEKAMQPLHRPPSVSGRFGMLSHASRPDPQGRTHSLFTMSNNGLARGRETLSRIKASDAPAGEGRWRIPCGADRARSSASVDRCRLVPPFRSRSPPKGDGGARRDRTDDLMLAKHALSRLSYCPEREGRDGQANARLVGLGRLELPTSRLSSARSNQLSYKPEHAGRPGPVPEETSGSSAGAFRLQADPRH